MTSRQKYKATIIKQLVICLYRSEVSAERLTLTNRCVGGCWVPSVGHDEEGLDEGPQGVDNVPEDLGGVLLHVIGLAEGATREQGFRMKAPVHLIVKCPHTSHVSDAFAKHTVTFQLSLNPWLTAPHQFQTDNWYCSFLDKATLSTNFKRLIVITTDENLYTEGGTEC